MPAAPDHVLVEVKNQTGRTSTQLPAISRLSQTDRSASETSFQKRSWKSWLGFASVPLAVLAAIAFYQPWSAIHPASVAAESHSTELPKTVIIARPEPAASASVVLPATFRPWQKAALHARVSGYLSAWHRDLGAPVRAGDLLAEIETPELDQELAEAQALASEADAATVQAQAERAEAEAELGVAQAQLVRVQAEFELAKSQLVRREKLIEKRAISQEEYDTFQRQLEARAADIAAAQSDVARRRTNLGTRTAVIEARQATATSRQANVDRFQELQGFKRIVAPVDGVITSRAAEVGMLVTVGQQPLFVVEDLSRIRVQVNVPQTYAMQVRPGAMANVNLPESQVEPVPSQVTRIAESVDPTSRTMLAEIELDNSEHRFQPGSYAQVTLATPPSGAAWTVPLNTVWMRVDGPHVALVNDQDRIDVKKITLGRDLGDRVVVAEGIRGHERLVVNPGDELAGGERVQVGKRPQTMEKVAQR
jgi:multidrug efflux pump subunit AcrA (membrane-fusion protein)